MSYTTDRQPQGLLNDTGTLLREGMIAEIVAINDYTRFISATDNKEVKDLFHHIREEEKHHYMEFLDALRSIDEEECKLAKEFSEHPPISERDKYKDESHMKNSKNGLLTDIRDAIKGELEAIVLYEDLISHLRDEKLIELIRHITKEEKEHTEELTKALTILDKDKYESI